MFHLSNLFPVSNVDHSGTTKEFINYALVDAFADSPFKGNPAAVCLLPSWQDSNWMQQVASELNSNMTAFLVAGLSKPDNTVENHGSSTVENYCIRWFTPVLEVDICGHATLASSYLLFGSGLVKGDVIHFHSQTKGVLRARKVDQPSGFLIELDFPRFATYGFDTLPGVLASTFKKTPLSLHTTAANDLLVELPSGDDVRQFDPDFDAIRKSDFRGLIVTGRACNEQPGIDFVSRFFAPKCGIDEDPVCGQAHCALAGFWAKKLKKEKLLAYQASKRGGMLQLRVDFEADRVFLQGKATLVLSGVIFLNNHKNVDNNISVN